MDASRLWRLCNGQSLRHFHWQDEWVVYNDLSGDTHLLDQPTYALLDSLRAGARTSAALCAAPDDPEELGATVELLERLAGLYLLEPCA